MLRQIIQKIRKFHPQPTLLARFKSDLPQNDNSSKKDDSLLREDLGMTGIHLDEIDQIMSDEALQPIDIYYPNVELDGSRVRKPLTGHNVVVVQPWASHTNFDGYTDPELQLEECVSLGNTIHNWTVIGKKIVFTRFTHRKEIVGRKAFDDLKNLILSHEGASAVMFGVELLSGVQLATLERALNLPVYDRFTVVLNIFRQHAKTREAKIQLALAELPYIRSHLREIHESSENSSAGESIKSLVGGSGERFYHQRLNVLKRRESRLKNLIEDFRKHRDVIRKRRIYRDVPIVSIVGYTNCGKTSLIKFLTQDGRLMPKDQLFATLDVTVHTGQLPTNKTVLYLDTVGFISRVPNLLIEAFSATLREVQDSDLIVHMLDITHPDHKLQYETVLKSLGALKVPKNLMDSILIVGNKADLLPEGASLDTLPKCEILVSATNGSNIDGLVSKIDKRLSASLKHEICEIRVENGGRKYSWLRKNSTLLECRADESDGNYLICRVSMSPISMGRWQKLYGKDSLGSRQYAQEEG